MMMRRGQETIINSLRRHTASERESSCYTEEAWHRSDGSSERYTHTHTHIVVLSAFYVDIMHSLTQWFPTIFGMDPILTSLRSRYEVQLHPGQLTLMPFRRHSPADSGVTSAVPMQIVIHLSDGDTCVQRTSSPDAFALITHKNQYQ